MRIDAAEDVFLNKKERQNRIDPADGLTYLCKWSSPFFSSPPDWRLRWGKPSKYPLLDPCFTRSQTTRFGGRNLAGRSLIALGFANLKFRNGFIRVNLVFVEQRHWIKPHSARESDRVPSV